MATAYIDRLDTLSMREDNGVVMRLTRMARVVGLTDTDYTVLMSALEEAGIPEYGASLPSINEFLILTGRSPVVRDKGIVDVELVYTNKIMGGQDLINPSGVAYPTHTSTINQVTANKDINGDQITVEHTYPATDPDYPEETRVQGGEVDVFIPNDSFHLEGMQETRRPWILYNNIKGAVNKLRWNNSAAHTWMCTNVTYKRMSPTTAYFTFDFQKNEDTWNPTVVYIDERTGRAPAGLVAGEGIKQIRYHREVNFEIAIGIRIEGGI